MPIFHAKSMIKRRGVARSRRQPGDLTKPELAYLGHLEWLLRSGVIASYRYECLKLRLADNTFYTPDFVSVGMEGEITCHEVKGTKKRSDGTYTYWAEEDAKLKIKIAAEMYHEFQFCIAYQLPAKAGGTWCFEQIGE